MQRLRWIETFLLLVITIQSIFVLSTNSSSLTRDIGVGITSAVLILYLLPQHKWRFELTFAYAALVANLCYLFANSDHPSAGLLIGLLAVAILITFLFQLPDFPALPGAYKTIGCVTKRINGMDCRVYYPSCMESHSSKKFERNQKRIPYLHHGHHLAKGLSVFSKVPAITFNNLQNGYLHARANLNIADFSLPNNESIEQESSTGWPIVVFSHGLGGSIELYTSIHEQIASEGIIVIALNHNDGSSSVVRVFNEEEPNDIGFRYYSPLPASALKDWEGEAYGIRNKQLQQRTREVKAVIDGLEEINNNTVDIFYHQFNLNDIALCGHSFGGATAFTSSCRDPRISAVVVLDGWLAPMDKDVLERGYDGPVLHIISQQWLEWTTHMETVLKLKAACPHEKSRLMTIKNSRHNNFSDLPLFSPVRIFSYYPNTRSRQSNKCFDHD